MNSEVELTVGGMERSINLWANHRGLFKHGNSKTQFLKVVEEVGELSKSVVMGKDVKDDIGDVVISLCVLAKMCGTSIDESVKVAWDDIKDRKGEMVNGTFVKDSK